MNLKRHFLDFSGTSVASAVATMADAAIYALLVVTLVNIEMLPLGVAAALGALVGGAIHYSLCRFWVFRRFDAPIASSLVMYFAMSWLAAAGHGLLTQSLASFSGAGLAWVFSKTLFWLLWTYPLSRFVVFHDDHSPPDANGGSES